METFEKLKAHSSVLKACEAIGFLHNSGKLIKKQSQRPFDFQKISDWTYFDHDYDPDHDTGFKGIVKDLFFDEKDNLKVVRENKSKEVYKEIIRRMSLFLKPGIKDDIEQYIDKYWEKHNSLDRKEKPSTKFAINTLISELIKQFKIPASLRSGFFLLKHSVVEGIELSEDEIISFIKTIIRQDKDDDFSFKINGVIFSLSMLLNIFSDQFHHRVIHDKRDHRQDNLQYWLGPGSKEISSLARVMAVCHEAISRGDKPETEDLGKSCENRRTNVFGKEINTSPKINKNEFLEKTLSFKDIKQLFESRASDGRVPVNDVSLYSYCYNFGAFFKTAVAGIILNGKYPEPHELQWRTLWFRIDGLEWISRGTRMADVISRRNLLDEMYNSLVDLLENRYPICKMIYSDINGIFFLAPDVENLLELELEKGLTLENKIRQVCLEKSSNECSFDMELSDPIYGYMINISKKMKDFYIPAPDMKIISSEWEMEKQKKVFLEVCTTCSLRPVDRHNPVAESQNLCRVCHERKTGRTRKWLENTENSTLWTSEIADENARCALITCRLDLSQWLDSEVFYKTMPKKCIRKNNRQFTSFTRVSDVWKTTKAFFNMLDNDLAVFSGLEEQKRWVLNVTMDQETAKFLKKYHLYEIEFNDMLFQAVYKGDNDFVFVDSKLFDYDMNKWENLLESTDNFIIKYSYGYGGKKQNIVEIRNLDSHILKQDGKSRFYPYINIMKDPVRFMALVPAQAVIKAVRVIEEEYLNEFERVQDRLPIQTGIVFFKAKMPLSSVLDAGKRILSSPFVNKTYVSKEINKESNKTSEIFYFSDGKFMTFPLKVCGFKDEWYSINQQHKEKIVVKPSLLDIFYLAENGKRHQLYYNKHGIRNDMDFGSMPVDLHDACTLAELWEIVGSVSRNQKSKIEESIHYLQNELDLDPCQEQGVRFVLNAFQRVENGFWHNLEEADKEKIETGLEKGLVRIMLRIWLHIFKQK